MHVTFGLNLDSRQGPSPQNYFNAPIVGRLGFLSLLETYLGLSAPEVAAAKRVAVYLGFLQRCDDGKRFYSESMKADSVGTAARLLAWRDEWRLGGWSGTSKPEHPARIKDLAAVEQVARAELPPSEAERLTAIVVELESTGPGPIQAVTLVDPFEDLPWSWRQVLSRLPNVKLSLPAPHGGGQLRAVQERALEVVSGGALGQKLPSITDGSIQVIRSLTTTAAEHWLSAHQASAPGDRLVVAEELGDALDTTQRATGGANCGFEGSSPLRPALQSLGLALELCWAPLDVGRLVDFLTHPIGPFRRSARAKLAEAVAEQPGIGGQAWAEAKAAIAKEDDGETLVEEIEFWLEGERWQRADGAPTEALLARVDRLREAVRRRLTGDPMNAATFAPAHRQCSAVFDGLTELHRQGQTKVLPRQVEQLVAHATPGGATNPASEAQVGCMRSASTAGACIESADEVVWWMPATPTLSQQLPWTAAEVQALKDIGVELRDPACELAALAMQWLRPLLIARQRFVLVLPPPDAEVHPVRQLLNQLVEDFETDALDLDESVGGQQLAALAEKIPKQSFPDVPRYIQLPSPVQLPQKPQSFTTLNELFNDPALYTLKRVARLNPTSVIAAEEDNRLLGTLAHRVFEKLFGHADALKWTDQQATDWFRASAGDLLKEEGAVLLMQGAGVSLQRFQMTCEGAIRNLLDHLRSAGAVQVQTEVEFTGVLGTVPLTGKIDLLIELTGKRLVALDMKWRGDSYYAGLLRDGSHLQLAIYSSLVEQQTGTAPAALGYFILESGGLYVTYSGLFPNGHVREPRNNLTVAGLLEQAKVTWEWRAGQLQAGQVEVVPEHPTDEFKGPDGTLPVNGPSKWDRDRLVLLGGWE